MPEKSLGAFFAPSVSRSGSEWRLVIAKIAKWFTIGDMPNTSMGELYATIFSSSPAAIVIATLGDGRLVELNDAFCGMMGFPREELENGRTEADDFWQEPADRKRYMEELAARGRTTGAEVRFKRKDGSLLVGAISSELIEVDGTRCALSVISDATERWRLERELREREAHYAALFDAMSSAVVEEDFSAVKAYVDGLRAGGVGDLDAYLTARPDELRRCAEMIRIVRFNDQFVAYLNLPDKSALGADARLYIPEGTLGEFKAEILALARGEKSIDLRFPSLLAGSPIEHVRLRLALVPGHEGDWSSVLFSFVDLTKEVKDSEVLAALLEEKDFLMRELEHRVKNNLNIVSSLLSLEAGRLEEGPQRALLRDTQSRIKSISLIYDLLSRSSQGAEMNARSYLESLASLLESTYMGSRRDVSLDLDVEDFAIDVKRGVSLGLVATELLTNAFKYAFPDRGGTVRLALRAGPEKVAMTVSDDGVGVPPGFDPAASETLGFQLIELLASQMQGTIGLEPPPGFGIRLEFPRL
jgi:PAS domain S-box-containing protein